MQHSKELILTWFLNVCRCLQREKDNGHGTRASIVGTVTHKSGFFCYQRTRFELIWLNLIKINEGKFGISPFIVLCTLCLPKLFYNSLTSVCVCYSGRSAGSTGRHRRYWTTRIYGTSRSGRISGNRWSAWAAGRDGCRHRWTERTDWSFWTRRLPRSNRLHPPSLLWFSSVMYPRKPFHKRVQPIQFNL